MATGPKTENRGGSREGAGRKPMSVSASQLRAIHDAADKRAQKEGRSLWDVCLDWVYDVELPVGQRQAAWKMYADKYVVQVSEGSEADRAAAPAVYLPGHRPQLETIEGGKEAA